MLRHVLKINKKNHSLKSISSIFFPVFYPIRKLSSPATPNEFIPNDPSQKSQRSLETGVAVDYIPDPLKYKVRDFILTRRIYFLRLSKLAFHLCSKRIAQLHLASKLLLPTSKNSSPILSPSHDFMLRAGLIFQSASGVYALLPLAIRALNKIRTIVSEELNKIGCLEVDLPTLQSANLWKNSGRWDKYGPELFRLQDRNGNLACLGPTHEEEVTRLAASIINSPRQMPLMVYQMGKKYRDELRPRAGLLRTKEFFMKDLYTFDRTEEEAIVTYNKVRSTYNRIFYRIGLPFVVAAADSGNIGGSLTHEFHFISSAGEDTVFQCSNCGYTANEELAASKPALSTKSHTLDVANQKDLLSLIPDCYIPECDTSVTLFTDRAQPGRFVLAVLPALQKSNITKLDKATKGTLVPVTLASTEFSSLKHVEVVLDESLRLKIPPLIEDGGLVQIHDIRLTQPGDICVKCNGNLSANKAIEVGHTFYLGTRYSEMFKGDFYMGCYGIGLTRILAASVECSHDAKGICWPHSIAPYRIIILPILPSVNLPTYASSVSSIKQALVDIYTELAKTDPSLPDDTVLDDRQTLTPGHRLKEADFLGYPISIRLGKEFLSSSKAEVHHRLSGKTSLVHIFDLSSHLTQLLFSK